MARKPIEVTTLKHDAATRRNIPTAELEAVMAEGDKAPLAVAYARRNPDLDPQLVWRGKEAPGAVGGGEPLTVAAPPLYIQEKVHPQVIIEDLRRQTEARAAEARTAAGSDMPDLFADFNGLPDHEALTEFYAHDQHWSNRMILGDSLSVMASLSEREGLRGQVQCIYFDPPYGIKFNSNFQWSTTTRDVKDGDRGHVTREPEQVRAFRDTWRDGIHSYLSYLRDRLTVARDLLTDSGSIFVQIGDENLHRVRAVMDEVFGDENLCSIISFRKTSGANSPHAKVNVLASVADYIIWYAKDLSKIKYRQIYLQKQIDGEGGGQYTWGQIIGDSARSLSSDERNSIDEFIERGGRVLRPDTLSSAGYSQTLSNSISYFGKNYSPPSNSHWKTTEAGISRLEKADRLIPIGRRLYYKRFIDDFNVYPLANVWTDVGSSGFGDPRIYVVQTVSKVIERCLLMATDPGDLVLDPTCGSGTTAYVAEQWGRRWITIDTSRVSLALARSRIMGARYPYYLLADSEHGRRKEAEITRSVPRSGPVSGDIRQGFVYERVPHITLKSIANNTEIDVIWDDWQTRLEPLRAALNAALGESWDDWQIPREPGKTWPEAAMRAHGDWWAGRIAHQREIDAAIAARADSEFLYDRPYIDRSTVRVAGPFTVETLSPHRTLAVDWDDELIDTLKAAEGRRAGRAGGPVVPDFAAMILENLRAAGVQQAHREDRISFTSLTGWPGAHICAEGRFFEGGVIDGAGKSGRERRAGILIGPEFGTVSRADLVAAAREAADAGFDLVIACAFNYDAHAAEFDRLGRVQVLRARMNPDLHMSADLKTTGAGNLFVIFGEPDIGIEPAPDAGPDMIRVRIKGVDVFKPQSGEVISEGPDGIALWMLDTAYNEESFFVRHAYFLGANDPYKALRTTLKAEIDQEAWDSLNADISRPFPKPATGRIAVKVINHLGDEVMKVFQVN